MEEGFRHIRERHFPAEKFPFAKGDNRIVQRRQLLEELKELDFSFHTLLVDKRKLHQKSPLQYKGTFYKFLSGLIYNNLYRTVPDLSIVANELGTPDFVESFRRYIQENHQVDLFSPATFTFSNAEEDVLLGLAGFLGDTDEENGALKVIPKTHFSILSDKEIAEVRETSESKCSKVLKGGVHLMRPLTLHASSKTENNKHRRVIHLEFNNKELPGELEWLEREEIG